jgi:putative SOS response-associated peptidase YedK
VWLDPTVRDVEPLQTLLMPDPADEMTAYPISTRVNKPAYDAPECIIPLT